MHSRVEMSQHHLGVWNKTETGIVGYQQGIGETELPSPQWLTTHLWTVFKPHAAGQATEGMPGVTLNRIRREYVNNINA